ncbi:auxin-responsive protein SAUR71-like [Zingiber officinale]|uniref:auxin-responsive protein SAUR71-like n=1 Tax=Zingiber officinale TaxID=94328 RepID=UPI001C4D1C15|nr:auxin-responsive protein SAUR71-like [Zingiber officinale]
MRPSLWRPARVADFSSSSKQCEGSAGMEAAAATEGHVPVCVGEEMERFEVPAELLSRPAFAALLSRSAREYGYQQRGVLRIPCPVPLFRRLLLAGGEAEAELLRALRHEEE